MMNEEIKIPWAEGGGNIIINSVGGNVTITSDVNGGRERSQVLTFRAGNASQTLAVTQKARNAIPFDYIGDGLTFHLDGIDKGGVPDKWVDLIKGKSFDNHGCTFLANGVSFNGIDNYLSCDDTEVMGTGNLGTIEICIDTPPEVLKSRVQMVYSHPSGNSLTVILEYNKLYYSYDIKSYYKLDIIQKNTISVHDTLSKQNKKNIIKMPEQTYRTRGTKIVVGARGDCLERFFYGTIHAIRIYNRQLTEEEILHNQQIDIDRFFGGVI